MVKQHVSVGILARLEAKAGKAGDLEQFLKGGLAVVEQEPGTTTWYAIRLGPTTFGIFDSFPGEAERDAHLNGRIPEALMARASELLAEPPSIQKVDVLAFKHA